MSEPDLRRLLDVCQEALARPAEQRAAFLAEACGTDTALRRAVEELIAEQSAAARTPTTPAWTPANTPAGSPDQAAAADVPHPRASHADRARLLAWVSAWPVAVIALTTLRIAFALVLFLSGHAQRIRSTTPLPTAGYAVIVATFGLLGLILVGANRRDVRAMWLGGVFLLAASPFSMPLYTRYLDDSLRWLAFIRADAFLPALLWRFVAAFPAPLAGRAGRGARWIGGTTALLALLLELVALSCLIVPGAADDWRLTFMPLPRAGGVYYPIVFGLSVAAFVAMLWRASRAHGDDRRRLMLFAGGFVGGSAPIVVETILEAVFPSYLGRIHDRPAVEALVATALFTPLAVVPVVTAYSVLFDRVVELRVALRAAVQYALARFTILAVTMVPFVALAVLFVRHREESLISFLGGGPRPIVLGASACAGLLTMRLRRRGMEALDRRFFRDQCDARQTLDRLATGALDAADAVDLAARIRGAIGPAFHADATLLVADDKFAVLRDPEAAHDELPLDAVLVSLVVALDDPMDIDPSDDRSPFRRLSASEQRWLLHGNLRLLIALRGKGRRPTGMLALSPKRSGLEYSKDDRRLISALAASASLALENVRLRATTESQPGTAARECVRCSRLHPPDVQACACGGALVAASAPCVLRGVYRLERRIGAGGMGVVYEARDLELDRRVAVKTLPRMSAQAAARLRTEARAMAAVVHPNLAVVHGIETWQGIPFLVEEFLAGGTLADRLRERRLSVAEALELGLALADAVGHLHAAGLVHRDIKPSNIGFTATGVVKVLDFGLARLVGESGTAGRQSGCGESAEHGVVGTPPYMAPEALLGQRPRPSFDLWSLAVVLYESLAGQRPFAGENAEQVRDLVARGSFVPVSASIGGCPAGLDDYFRRALNPDEALRPKDANAVKNLLRGLQAPLA